jgi:hypothetical protein
MGLLLCTDCICVFHMVLAINSDCSPQTLTGWALQRRRIVCPVRYELYLCVPYGSHINQRLFPQTALTGWALWRRRNMYPVRYGLYLCVP